MALKDSKALYLPLPHLEYSCVQTSNMVSYMLSYIVSYMLGNQITGFFIFLQKSNRIFLLYVQISLVSHDIREYHRIIKETILAFSFVIFLFPR